MFIFGEFWSLRSLLVNLGCYVRCCEFWPLCLFLVDLGIRLCTFTCL